MRLIPTAALTGILFASLASSARAAPTHTQLCESAMEAAAAKYAQCRLNAESRYSKALDAAKRTAAQLKCSTNLGKAFSKTTGKYGAACAATEPSAAFDAYLSRCSDDTAAAAGGAALPDYAGELASCNADLSTAQNDLATCQGDLAACEALPSAPLLKTGQTTNYGPGDDGDLQKGVAQNYVDNGDGTITDTKTGLMWEKKLDDGTVHDKDNTYTWSSSGAAMDGTVATDFLAMLNAGGGFAGHTDWRLPNRRELESLVDLQHAGPAVSAAFNTNCDLNARGNTGCTATPCSCTAIFAPYYWSSSSLYGFTQYAWVVDFNDGTVTGHITKNGPGFYARAVRGGS